MAQHRLWIANTTKQIREFTYRLLTGVPGTRLEHTKENNKSAPAAWKIKPGGQICIEDNFTLAEISQIIEQNERYGLKPVPEALSRETLFIGLMYSTEKPINVDAIMRILEGNDKVLEQEAQERREETAGKISTNIARELSNQTGAPLEQMRPARVEVETVEETTGAAHVASGVEVIANRGRTSPRHARG